MSLQWVVTCAYQIGVLFQKDAKLAIRRWQSSLSRILMPSLILFVYWLALSSAGSSSVSGLFAENEIQFLGNAEIEAVECFGSAACAVLGARPRNAVGPLTEDYIEYMTNGFRSGQVVRTEADTIRGASVRTVQAFVGADDERPDLTLKGPLSDDISGVELEAANGWPWVARAMRNANVSISLVYAAGNERQGDKSDELDADEFTEVASVVTALVLFVAFFPFQLATHAIVTEDRRNKLDTSLRVAGTYVGSIVASQFLIELIFAGASALLFTVLGAFVLRVPYMAWQPVLVFFISFAMAMNHAVYGFVLGRMFHRIERASALVFVNFIGGLGLIALLGMDRIFRVMGTMFSVPLNWWSIFGFAQNEVTLVHSLFTVVATNTTLAANTPIRVQMNATSDSTVYTVQQHFNFLFLDVFVFLFLAYYLGYVRPGDSGVAKGCCFCVNPFFWLDIAGSSESVDIDSLTTGDNEQMVMASLDEDINRECLRTNALARDAADTPLILLQLTKLYRSGRLLSKSDVRAVDAVTVHGEAGSVLAVLGHNGAGKSSLLAMLSQTSAPSFGDALIWGKPLSSNTGSVTQCMGFCPQENITWPMLTVRENVQLYSRLKRGDPAEVDAILKSVELFDRRHDYGHTLSGGMKRRLTFAMALVAKPSIVVLDEPTSGLDAKVKQVVWNVIEQLRSSETLVVLCTHDMAEAEGLADKLAIMAKGRLRSVGKIQPLKERFKIGYRVQLNVSAVEHIADVQQAVAKIIGAEVNHTLSARALTYRLPMSAALALVSKLEKQSVEHVEFYEFSQGDVEDLFMRVIHGVESVGEIDGAQNGDRLSQFEQIDDDDDDDDDDDEDADNKNEMKQVQKTGSDNEEADADAMTDADLFQREFVQHEKTKKKVAKLAQENKKLKSKVKELEAQLAIYEDEADN